MDRNIPIAQKRGCDKYSLNLILVNDSVDSVSKVFTEYFGLEVYANEKIQRYINLENNAWNEYGKLQTRLSKAPETKRTKLTQKLQNLIVLYPTLVWGYCNHNWSLVFLHGKNDAIAFAFSTLLDTDVITFWESDNVCCSEFKFFRSDKLVEHYEFGLECGKLYDDYWNLIVECESDWLSGLEEHKFSSSIRKVTPEEIKFAVDTNKSLLSDRGFVDSCLKNYDAYIPTLEETPLNYHVPDLKDNLAFKRWHDSIEQMDIIMLSNNWSYYDFKVPQQVIKN